MKYFVPMFLWDDFSKTLELVMFFAILYYRNKIQLLSDETKVTRW